MVRVRWAPPPTAAKGSRNGQRQVARGRWAPPAADITTTRRHANPPPPPSPPRATAHSPTGPGQQRGGMPREDRPRRGCGASGTVDLCARRCHGCGLRSPSGTPPRSGHATGSATVIAGQRSRMGGGTRQERWGLRVGTCCFTCGSVGLTPPTRPFPLAQVRPNWAYDESRA